MFRQSIDPRGAFPPKSSKKPVKKKKKKPIKRRKRTRDRFASERKQEQVFRFGERRSGLSGRTLNKPEGRTEPRQPPPSRNDNRNNFNPADYLRIHNQAIKNQLRDIAETKATGGTFTGTSIGEEKRVREAQQADREFKRQEADTRRRFVGAVEKLVDKVSIPTPAPTILPAPAPAPIRLPDREIVEELRDIKKELKKKPVPVIKFGDDDPVEELFGVADIEDITIRDRRPPEDDINYLSSTRSKRSPTPTPSVPAPRPSPSNPIDAKGRAEIEAIRQSISTPFRVPEPEPEPQEEETPKDRRKLFLEEQDDTDEFLTPLEPPPPKAPPTEIPIIPPPLSAGIPQPKSDTEIVDIAKKVKAKKEEKKLSPEEIVERAKKVQKEAEEDLEQDTTSTESSEEEQSPDPTRIQARLENYKQLARFSESQKSIPRNFDNEKQHYRLEVLEDIEPEELGRQKRVGGLSKGERFRLQRTDYKGQAIANRGFYFYRDNKGKQMKPTQANLFKINLANPKVDTKFQEAIKQGKIKIVFDEFDDEI